MARTPSPLPSAHRRIRGFEATSGLLRDQIRKVGESRGFAVARLLTHWPEIAGEDMARITRPGQGRLWPRRHGGVADAADHRAQCADRRDAEGKAARTGQRRLWLCRDFAHPDHPDRRHRFCRRSGRVQPQTQSARPRPIPPFWPRPRAPRPRSRTTTCAKPLNAWPKHPKSPQTPRKADPWLKPSQPPPLWP